MFIRGSKVRGRAMPAHACLTGSVRWAGQSLDWMGKQFLQGLTHGAGANQLPQPIQADNNKQDRLLTCHCLESDGSPE